MALSLYLLWRAVAEVRLSLFLLGGLAMAMAAMTRTEGLFLLMPLLLWAWKGAGSREPGAGSKDTGTQKDPRSPCSASPRLRVSCSPPGTLRVAPRSAGFWA